MRIISIVLAIVLALPAMAQEVVETVVDEGVQVADSVSELPTFGAMDEAALEALEAKVGGAGFTAFNVHHGPSAGGGYYDAVGAGGFGFCFLYGGIGRAYSL